MNEKAYYTDLLADIKLPNEVREKVKASVEANNYMKGAYQKIVSAYLMAGNVTFPADSICTVFRITRHGTTSNYAFLYSVWDQDDSKFEDYFICFGGSLNSCDGEYRKMFFSVSDYEYITQGQKYPKLLALVEDIITELVGDKKVELRADIFYPKFINFVPKEFDNYVNGQRWAIKLLSLAWLYYFRSINDGLVENHINPAFQYIFYQKKMKPVYEKVMSSPELGKLYDDLFILLENGIGLDTSEHMIPMGQKLFPVTNEDIINIYSINSNIWRELYLTAICSRIVVNYGCASFPFAKLHVFIQNVHPSLFDNNSQFIKYSQSKLGEELRNLLLEKDKKMYEYVDEEANIKKYISPNFKELSEMFKKAKKYADKYIVLSDLVFSVISLNEGRTFKDLPQTAKSSNELFKPYRDLFVDPKIFQAQLFCTVYALLAMNKLGGIIHGDLHPNNFIIKYMHDERPEKNMHNIFKVGDTQAFYVPYDGFMPVIIDFSRSIFADYEKITADFGGKECSKFKNIQKKAILKMLKRYFPNNFNSEEDRGRIEWAIDERFPKLFNALTLIDTYFCMYSMQQVLEKQSEITVNSDIMEQIASIKKHAHELFLVRFQSVLDDKMTNTEALTWPNMMILNEYFSDYLTPPDDFTPIDLYNLSADLKYEIVEGGENAPEFLAKSRAADTDKAILEGIKEARDKSNKNIKKLIGIYTNKIEQDEITLF